MKYIPGVRCFSLKQKWFLVLFTDNTYSNYPWFSFTTTNLTGE